MEYFLPKSACIQFGGESLEIHDSFLLLLRTTSSFNFHNHLTKVLNTYLEQNYQTDLSNIFRELVDQGFILSKNMYYLDNYYYDNTSGVLKGICNLDGSFNSFNLVKYASYEEVLNELNIVAKSFKHLSFKSTIYDSCISEDSKKPLFSFVISKGNIIETKEHLSNFKYVHKTYEKLNLTHMELFYKFILNYLKYKDIFDFKENVKSNNFISFLY